MYRSNHNPGTGGTIPHSDSGGHYCNHSSCVPSPGPEKAQRETWAICKRIEVLKAELSSRCRGLYLADDYATEQTVFQSFNSQLSDVLEADIEVTESHRERALSNLERANLVPRAINGAAERTADDKGAEEQTPIRGSEIRELRRRVVSQ